MSREDVELERWRREWQELGGRDGLANELAARVVKDGRRLRRGTALELAGAAFSSGVCMWLIARTRGELVVVAVCAAILVFNGVWVTRLLTLRQGTLRAVATGLDPFVELTRRRLANDLKWNAFTRRAMQVLTLLLVPWGLWAFVSRYELYRAEPWRAVVGFGVAALILVAVFLHQRWRRAKLEADRERFESLFSR